MSITLFLLGFQVVHGTISLGSMSISVKVVPLFLVGHLATPGTAGFTPMSTNILTGM